MAGLICKNSLTLSVKCPVFEVSYLLNVPSINCRVYGIVSLEISKIYQMFFNERSQQSESYLNN